MNKNKIRAAIFRSERAYQLYIIKKRFFEALRIYNANVVIYRLLQEYQLVCSENELGIVCDYIFHLEDWMKQFEFSRENINSPDEIFVFERWEGSVPFSHDFINNLLRK